MVRKEKPGIGKTTELCNQVVVLANEVEPSYTGPDVEYIPGFSDNSPKLYGAEDSEEKLKPHLLVETPTIVLRDNIVEHISTFSLDKGYTNTAGAFQSRSTQVNEVYTMCTEYEEYQLPLAETNNKPIWGCRKCPKWDDRYAVSYTHLTLPTIRLV